MSYKIFIDGKEGTTGLRIADRFKDRSDIEILEIPEEKRKDTEERKKYINASDYTFLCLPDAAAVEAVSLVENDHTKIIDASTAHRTNPDWVYGLPELSKEQREVVYLKYAQELSFREIAEILGIPARTVQSRLRISLKKLRKKEGKPDA